MLDARNDYGCEPLDGFTASDVLRCMRERMWLDFQPNQKKRTDKEDSSQ